MQFKGKHSIKKIKKIFEDESMHIEEARGTYEQNEKYCKKENNFWEHGEAKKGGDIKKNI